MTEKDRGGPDRQRAGRIIQRRSLGEEMAGGKQPEATVQALRGQARRLGGGGRGWPRRRLNGQRRRKHIRWKWLELNIIYSRPMKNIEEAVLKCLTIQLLMKRTMKTYYNRRSNCEAAMNVWQTGEIEVWQ